MGFFDGVKKNVYILGAVSFLTDVSSEMIFPILPIFLTTILGASTAILGLIEGIADSAASLLDIFVGRWSDSTGKRKQFVIAGYGLSSISKIGIALANTWPWVLVARGIERIGKSIRTSPRDAIIAASSDEKTRGTAFGLHRAMDTLGAIAGPIIAYFILAWIGNTEAGYRAVFYWALVPAFLAVLAILLFVKEPKEKKEKKKEKVKFWKALSMLKPDYKRFLAVSCVFSLAYFSFALLIVRANDIGIKAQDILLVYVLYNIVYALASVPIGKLSDNIGRKPVIAASFALYGAVLAGFAFVTTLWQVAVLFAIYGIFVSADESVNKAYISDITEDKMRGTALGAYNSAVGAVYLPASALFGALWAGFGPIVAFGLGAIIAFISAIGMYVYAK